MIVRAASRRQRRHTSHLLAASFAQLNLPWLAPAQLRWTASQSTAISSSSSSQKSTRPRRSNSFRASPATARTRNLATATDQYTLQNTSHLPPSGYGTGFRNAAADRNLPFDFSQMTRDPSKFPDLGRQHDPPIMLNSATSHPDASIRVRRGLSGTVRQLLAHLDTSLKVGRRDRAEAIVQRLTEQCGPKADESLHAHEVYMEHRLMELMLQGRDSPQSAGLLSDLQRWFEVEIRNKGVPLSPKLLVIMLRAAIRALEESRRERSIRRYIAITKMLGDEKVREVLNSDDLDDNEYAILGRAVPDLLDLAEEPEILEPVQAFPDTAVMSKKITRQAGDIDLETVPEVLATEQKGIGLENIKKAMETFTKGPSLSVDASPQERRQLAESRQLELERTSVEVAMERWREADAALRKIGIHTSMQTKPVGALMWQWHQNLVPALEKELEEVKQVLTSSIAKDSDRAAYGPYLELLSLKKIAATTILFTMSKMNAGKTLSTGNHEQDVKLAALTTGLANAIEAECVVETASDKHQKGWRHTSRLVRPTKISLTDKAAERSCPKKSRKAKPSNEDLVSQLEWPAIVKVKLGAMLISKLIESAQLPVTRSDPRTRQKITQMQPAFMHRIKFQRGKKTGLVSPNPELIKKLQSEPVGALIAKRMPMVVEPKPWKGWSEGGYLHYPNPVLRLPAGDTTGKDYFIAADARGDLEQVYKGLTSLGKVPWKVHSDVFKVQLEAWNSGEAIANFAPLHHVIEKPEEPEGTATDPSLRKKWLSDVRDVKNRESGLHSQRCFQNFQMEIARTVVNETLYFPHNMDFRGRAYPIPPYLNHMGADNVRGLLTFAEGKELGEKGLRWLKIHLATVAGHDKASLEERLRFTEAHMQDIYDSAQKPLDGRRWWLESEDAWQTLAACFELTQALDSPDPTKFVSHLPIQQDGTCNGLQHYAALGGDKAGAQQVNLEPGDRPADVYTAVLKAVETEVEADAELGNPIAQKLHGRLTRKCVKQPVMTNVYGVTFYGARLQVAKQLEVLFPEVGRHDVVNINSMSHYIATKIFKSLGTMFAGAQAIQTWLGQCADRISTCLTPQQVEELRNRKKAMKPQRRKKSRPENEQEQESAEAALVAEGVTAAEGKKNKATKKSIMEAERSRLSKPLFKSTVVWTTPLRLPVVQPYRKSKPKMVSTTMQNISLQDPKVWDPVSKRKQLQAFPPNFIHSLDATHMLLSATKCSANGMTFASIHDSFWTHACNVDDMRDVLREAFVAMHKEDIVGRLREEFQARYKGCMYLASVTRQSVVGQKVVSHRAQTKKAKNLQGGSEFAVEAERMRLCNSEDAEERAKGEAMITPGSIVSAEADETAFSVPTEMAGQTLGEIPGTVPEAEATGADSDATCQQQTDSPLELNDAEATEGLSGGSHTAPGSGALETKKETNVINNKIFVWLPLTFPEVPKKGEFKVETLLTSKYFFH